MVQLPAKCTNPKCGHAFQNNAFVVEGGGTIHMSGPSHTSCPKCGHLATVPQGTYTELNGEIDSSHLSSEAKRLFRELKSLYDSAKTGGEKISATDIEKIFSRRNINQPEKLTSILRKIGVTFFLAIIINLMGNAKGSTLNINELIDQVAIISGKLSPQQIDSLIKVRSATAAQTDDTAANDSDDTPSAEPHEGTTPRQPHPASRHRPFPKRGPSRNHD